MTENTRYTGLLHATVYAPSADDAANQLREFARMMTNGGEMAMAFASTVSMEEEEEEEADQTDDPMTKEN
jgi:hypothetical protein